MVTALVPTVMDMTAMVSINIRSYSVYRFMLGLSLQILGYGNDHI